MSFPRGFKTRANEIALRIRERMGLHSTAPIDPHAVCERFDIRVIRLSEIDKNHPFLRKARSDFSAVTVPCGHQRAIVHNDSHHLHRQRSNICHELAHCFLGHKSTPPLTENGERSRDGGIEAEANYLGGALLVTNEAALHILKQGLIRQAQQIYGVSSAMLNYRLRVSGAQKIYERSLRY